MERIGFVMPNDDIHGAIDRLELESGLTLSQLRANAEEYLAYCLADDSETPEHTPSQLVLAVRAYRWSRQQVMDGKLPVTFGDDPFDALSVRLTQISREAEEDDRRERRRVQRARRRRRNK